MPDPERQRPKRQKPERERRSDRRYQEQQGRDTRDFRQGPDRDRGFQGERGNKNPRRRKRSLGPVIFYTIPDILDHTPEPTPMPFAQTVTGFRVNGSALSADTFDLEVDGVAIVSGVAPGATWTEANVYVAADAEICAVVNTLGAGTGQATCQIRFAAGF